MTILTQAIPGRNYLIYRLLRSLGVKKLRKTTNELNTPLVRVCK